METIDKLSSDYERAVFGSVLSDTERALVDKALAPHKRYDRGDWVVIRHGLGTATRLALILDRSDRSAGNYRGTIIAGTRACAERTILWTEIIGPAPDGKRLCDARVAAGVRCPATCTRCQKKSAK